MPPPQVGKLSLRETQGHTAVKWWSPGGGGPGLQPPLHRYTVVCLLGGYEKWKLVLFFKLFCYGHRVMKSPTGTGAQVWVTQVQGSAPCGVILLWSRREEMGLGCTSAS